MMVLDYLNLAAEATPDKTAIICGEQRLSYKQLDQLSEKISIGLKNLGVVPGEKIAIYMDKSLLAVISIYAILKTECCYVPISPDSPWSRVTGILNNCVIQHLLIDDQLNHETQTLFHNAKVNTVSARQLLETINANRQSVLAKPGTNGTDPVAILHTSGSTGVPKGAVITQKNLAVFVSWAISAFDLDADDRLLSHAPLQFDLSFFDLFAAVAASATVVLATPADTVNASRMAQLVNDTGVTIWQSVPSALTLQVVSNSTYKQPEIMPNVRCVLFAGERMPRQTVLNIPTLFPNADFYNIYGCTETNNTFMYQLPADVSKAPDPLPLGKVLPHIQHRIVDEYGVNVSPGTKGHLLVAGETMMIGYIGLDEAGISIYNNSNCINGFYQTNDIVSVENDGNVYFHGRLDNVIKSNGYRINLMEIEDQLWQSGKFVEVAVLCEADDLIGNRIIAVLRPESEHTCSVLDLKIYCAQTLPKYAIPHSFYFSSTVLPKSSTGKIDKHQVAQLWQSAVGY